MKSIIQKMTFKTATFILVIALLLPSVVKFSHVFSHHQHEVCNGENQTHLHKSDISCDFYKFKLSSSFTLPTIEFKLISVEVSHQITNSSYSFLNEYPVLHFFLRGPPQINLV